jgi:hypothetical protein
VTEETTSKEHREQWYSARLLYERLLLESPDGDELADSEPLFEDKLIVFRVKEGQDVVAKLTALAEAANHEYEAAAGNWVKWVFREILEIRDITAHEIDDGTEVYFRWWTNPTEHDFQIIRETHSERWWLEGDDSPGQREA